VERLTGEYLPLLLRTAGDVSGDWALWQSRPYSEVRYDQPERSSFASALGLSPASPASPVAPAAPVAPAGLDRG
jgi:hypothetical protein